jgi:hypothetical protein
VSRPSALLVSPILPAAGGNGLAMRAGVFLDVLAAEREVTLLLVPVAGGGEPSDFVLRRARRLAVLPLEGALDPLYSLSAGLRDPAARLEALRVPASVAGPPARRSKGPPRRPAGRGLTSWSC